MTAAPKENKQRHLVRFPNESFFEEVLIETSEFQVVNEFEDESFGWYKGIYISLKKN
jgi:hypothetical protein